MHTRGSNVKHSSDLITESVSAFILPGNRLVLTSYTPLLKGDKYTLQNDPNIGRQRANDYPEYGHSLASGRLVLFPTCNNRFASVTWKWSRFSRSYDTRAKEPDSGTWGKDGGRGGSIIDHQVRLFNLKHILLACAWESWQTGYCKKGWIHTTVSSAWFCSRIQCRIGFQRFLKSFGGYKTGDLHLIKR